MQGAPTVSTKETAAAEQGSETTSDLPLILIHYQVGFDFEIDGTPTPTSTTSISLFTTSSSLAPTISSLRGILEVRRSQNLFTVNT